MNLSAFNTANLFEAATDLFRQLGIKLNSNYSDTLKIEEVLKGQKLNTPVYKTIGKTFFIGIIDDSVFEQTVPQLRDYKDALQQADKSYEGLMLFALELSEHPNRSEISELTRAFNRISQKMPVALVLKYPMENENTISISISERFKYKQKWRQGEKAGKVIILRDIHTQTTHAGHLRILLDLVKPVAVTNYAQLHEHWLQVLDVNILNKKFFRELANWYFWAMDNVQFPDDIEKKKEVRNATNLIRLITRIIFIWFIKEKKLVPANLFRKDFLVKTVKDFAKDKKSENYYQAILQNLFFGTLNQKMNERGFVKEGNFQQNRTEYGVKNLFRYADKFTISEKDVIQLFKDVPFLNGGLFDCLDKPNEAGTILYVDGFSRNAKWQATVPDYLFFGEEQEVDLNEIFGTINKKYKVKGLVNLLESYKFTVAENTPIEEEIALDPELLGKVFENLLASYNPETHTTARKQTGSFYTPREIVNYMVDESLLEYLKQCLNYDSTDSMIGVIENKKQNQSNQKNQINPSSDNEQRLRDLFSYSENANPFNEKETKILIEAINNCKILDPACGSGAFPMGVLHKMVHILTKLDPDNTKWKAEQEEKIIGDKIKELEKDKKAIEGLSDAAVKEKARKAVDERLNEVKEIFESENNFDDYARKLFLIENCIYGIDIQPIAVQIAKLRFFISLIIDQNKQEGKENFGIRSLPNLETKFVAANTLIGLEIPTTDLFSENNPIKDLQEELKNVRHLYFNAKTRKEKLQFQNRDKQLRKAMSEKIKTLLVEKNEDEIIQIQADIEKTKLALQKIEKEPERVEIIETINLFGEKEQKKINKKQEKIKAQNDILKLLENKLKSKQNTVNKDAVLRVAENIASFDPYDQNYFANWFEPEWMFGLTEGFDIVIGNPPYVVLQADNNDRAILALFKQIYSVASYKVDLYHLFIENGIKLLRKNGILAFINPSNFLSNNYTIALRKFILTETEANKIINIDDDVFEASVNTCILVLKKSKLSINPKITFAFGRIINNHFELSKLLSQNQRDFITDKYLLVPVESIEVGEVLKRIESRKRNIKSLYNVNFGMQLRDRSKYPEDVLQNPDKVVLTKYHQKCYTGKDISNYSVTFNNRYCYFNRIAQRGGCWDEVVHYSKNKILVRQVGATPIAGMDILGFPVLNSAFMFMITPKTKEASTKFLLAIINSKLVTFFWMNRFADKRKIFPKIKGTYIDLIPIPEQTENWLMKIEPLVDKILLTKAENPAADTSPLEKQLDEMVYKLYELTEEEIAIIENKK